MNHGHHQWTSVEVWFDHTPPSPPFKIPFTLSRHLHSPRWLYAVTGPWPSFLRMNTPFPNFSPLTFLTIKVQQGNTMRYPSGSPECRLYYLLSMQEQPYLLSIIKSLARLVIPFLACHSHSTRILKWLNHCQCWSFNGILAVFPGGSFLPLLTKAPSWQNKKHKFSK